MKKITKKLIFGVLLSIGVFSSYQTKAQLTITPTSSLLCSGNPATCNVTNSVSGTTSYSWAYTSYPCGSAPAISGTFASTPLNFPCSGMYQITCYALNSSNAVIGTSSTSIYAYPAPTISVSGTSVLCFGSTTSLVATGAWTYTWSIGSTGNVIVVTPSTSTCYSVIGTNSIGCTSTNVAVHCVSLQVTNISINPTSANVCKGSSASFTASGANTYTWSTVPVSNNSSINVIPQTTGMYTVSGTDLNGCYGSSTVFVTVDTTCSNVWPGDANRDGVVNNSDVFEIGLAYNNTGTARSPGGNNYSSQFANNWVGTVSTGWNKAHADCNGDGTINNSDTLAIFNNYLMTHSFKLSESALNGDISFASNSTNVNEGMWSKVDILLGSSASPVNQVYGVAFDVNFDQSLIESNSAYIVYTPSFLNAANQNVQFRKGDFSNGKIYAASVRVNGSNVSGSGKIGEFWFKAKTGLPANSVFNISASNASRINNSKVSAALTGGSTSLTVVKNAVGINENNLERSIQLFPNPASNVITLQSTEHSKVSYTIFDIVGREIVKGEFSNIQTIDLSAFAGGTYIVRFESEGSSTYKKFVVEK